MILVDSSVWVDHLRVGEPLLVELLNMGRVMVHPFVIGELACGNLKHRAEILSLLQNLPATPFASDVEVLFFIAHQRLMGKGIGYVDAHLLAAVSLRGSGKIWTRDKRLKEMAVALRLAHHAT